MFAVLIFASRLGCFISWNILLAQGYAVPCKKFFEEGEKGNLDYIFEGKQR